MATEENALGAPPVTLTPAQVRAKLEKKDKIVDVPGYGPMRYKSLTITEADEVRQLATNGGGQPDPNMVALWGVIRSFPESFTDADIEWMRDADFAALSGLIQVMGEQSGRGEEQANGPLTFRKVSASSKRVPSGKRARS